MDWDRLLNFNRKRESRLSDHRSAFERDYGRIIFSTPFKRLQDKTQVFPLEANDSIRTRLTHTLEVSSLSRGIAAAVEPVMKATELDWNAEKQRDVETLAATAALVHDLGNPPFGHAGEDAIREWFKSKIKRDSDFKKKFSSMTPQQRNDFLYFEGNAQSLRLVRSLQVLGESAGLNLTYGSYSACLKYTANSVEADKDSSEHAHRKPGYFFAEEPFVNEVQQECSTGRSRNPITFIVEAADDIVNATADIEDAVKRGVLRFSDVEDWISQAGIGLEDIDTRIMSILDPDRSAERPFTDDEKVTAFRTAMISVLVESVRKVFQDNYVSIMNGEFKGDLVSECDASELHRSLESIKGAKVFGVPAILKLELTGLRIIGNLMDILWTGISDYPLKLGAKPRTKTFEGKAGLLVSENYARVFQKAVGDPPANVMYYRCLLLTDYICGMTDGFAVRLHSELTDGHA